MNYLFKLIISICILTFLSANDIKIEYDSVAEKIIRSLDDDSLGYKRLAYLCDMFGPRLSGSKNLEKAIDWIIKEMKNDGLSSVRGERVKCIRCRW